MSTLTDLQAAFPGKIVTYTGAGYDFVPPCNAAELVAAYTIIDPEKGKAAQAKADVLGLGNWATLTQAEFATWCTNNLLTDAAIDALTLNAGLKTNIKAINLFVINGGKLLLALRNVAFWLLKLSDIN